MHRHAAKTTPKPIALGEKQRTRYGVKWIIEASERQSGKTFEERLAREIISVVQGNSEAVNKKKMEAHRFAMVNRCAYTASLVWPLFEICLFLQGKYQDSIIGCPGWYTVLYETVRLA